MQNIQSRLQDKIWLYGMILLVISLSVFGISLLFTINSDTCFALFAGHFAMTALYFFVLLFSGRLRKGRNGLQPVFIWLLLFLVSAYSLNRVVSVFDSSTNWFAVVLVLMGTNYLLFGFFNDMPAWLRYVICFVLGASLIVFLYLALCLLPLYGVSLAAFFLLGISLHSFVPLLFLLYTIKLIRRTGRQGRLYSIICWWGAGIVISAIAVYTITWHSEVAAINRYYKQEDRKTGGLPAWIKVAQQIKPGVLTEKILKLGIVYKRYNPGGNWFWAMPSRNFDEQVKHDPLVVIGSFFSGELMVPEEDRIKMLGVIYDARHQAEERLWQGEHLQTVSVNTTVQVWPQLYLSYTQLNMIVANEAPIRNWSSRQEEAIYTFRLPEGGVVSSLSLWINGKEEKGILTSKGRADSAYKTIVGVQARDPSVVHWQEGNRVTVRVFPVEAGKERRFQIGVTAPLQNNGQQLVYQPFYFDGPSATQAQSVTNVRFEQAPEDCELPGAFSRQDDKHYIHRGSYNTDWQFAFNKHKPQHDAFSFDGQQYRLYEYIPQRTHMDCKQVYLDVNRQWTLTEWEKVLALLPQKQAFVAGEDNQMIPVNPTNQQELFQQLQRRQFSLFPFHKISHPERAMVISKSSDIAPLLKDLQGTEFARELTTGVTAMPRVRLFNMSNVLNPYLQSLKQAGRFCYEQGDLVLLQQLLAASHFAGSMENEQQVVLHNAGLMIVREDSTTAASPVAAPDHLMRLFTYNSILQQAGVGLLTGKELSDTLVAAAEKAHVVTPVSSLIVLEKQKDYDDFDIKASKNSLENAAIHSKGAVPEPHEWALIILVIVALIWVSCRQRLFVNGRV